ncbi:MAG: metabolite traffic protein EboE [Verrucomicrobiota bacterium]|nr:metabolite traffic protein EboE [Limisphaera sp.]MDW8382857.1 metabolite traffic protein EboE [Verrucomicrobiota bacterium]
MKLLHGLHLAHCTNQYRGETWAETLSRLEQIWLPLRDRIGPDLPLGLSLRLSGRAARELNDPTRIREFRKWLDRHYAYVFSIHSFPCGHFRDRLVPPRVFVPDWTSPERTAYTNLLCDLLVQLLPAGLEGSISTLPGSVKGPLHAPEELVLIRKHLWQCIEHLSRTSERTGRMIRLALEPAPYCLLETSGEVIEFFLQFRREYMNDSRLLEYLTVAYDAAHFAVEYEDPGNVLTWFRDYNIKLGKIQLGVVPRICPSPEICDYLDPLREVDYLHHVIAWMPDGQRVIYRSLAEARHAARIGLPATECRIHLHAPLRSPDGDWFLLTHDHVLTVLDIVAARPSLCRHLEIETQTWDLLPEDQRTRPLDELIAAEYKWVLDHLQARGITPMP